MKPIAFIRKAFRPGSTRKPAAAATATVIGCAALAALFAACIMDDKQASSRGTVVDNEMRVGSIYLADGSPAVGARVRVFPVGYVPDSSSSAPGAIFSTRTDAMGRYAVDTLPKGEYNILGESDGEYSYQDSVFIAPNTDSISADTLENPGSIVGTVGLQPQHDPRNVVVQVLGTNSYVNVRDDGSFVFSGLAQGKYSLKLITTLKEYTPLFSALSVRKGKTDTLKDTLRLPFTGIPVVQGLTASYDTIKGVVVLKWKPVKYRDFSEYVVFRDVAPVLSPSVTALAIATDTLFYDTLAKTPGGFAWGPGSVSVEYRVKVKNQTDEIGPSYGKARVVVVNPDELGTKVRIDTVYTIYDPARQKDSIFAVAVLTSTKAITDSLYWMVQDSLGSRIAKQVKFAGGLSARDTLRIDATGSRFVVLVAQTVDDIGRRRVDTAMVRQNTPPSMVSWPDTLTVLLNYPLAMDLSPMDPDGDSLSLTVEGLPGWLSFNPHSGFLRGTPGPSDSGDYSGIIFKLSDGLHTVTRHLHLRVVHSPWGKVDTLAGEAHSPSLAVMGTHLFAFNPARNGSIGNIQIYDAARGFWLPTPTTWTFRNRVAMPYAGKILLAGNDDSLAAAIYDTTTRALKFLARASYIIPEQTHCAAANGKLYCMGPPAAGATPKTIVREYDPAADKWTAKQDVPFQFTGAAMTGLQNRIYVRVRDSLFIYDPAGDAWSIKPPPIIDADVGALCSLGGKVILASASVDSSAFGTHLQSFDPLWGTWTVLEDSPNSQYDFSCAEMEGRLYLVGGSIHFGAAAGYGSLLGGAQTFNGIAEP